MATILRPLCTMNLATSQFSPEKPCGRVMNMLGHTERSDIPVFACPRCDKANDMLTKEAS